MAGLATGFGDDADSMDMDSGGPSGPPQAMGGTAGVLASGSPMAGVQQNPDPSAAPKRHGGLLTGLVGVLLDGLSAGVRTPPGPAGPAQAAQTASQMPQQRQQQQITFQNQQMMQKAQIAQAHVQQMQTRLLASGLEDEVASGLTDAAWKFATNSVEQGTAKMVSGTGTREAAFDKLKELHDSASPDEQGNLFAYPSGKDKDGKSQWAVYQTYPNKTLTEDTKFHLDGDDANKIDAVDKTYPKGTPMSVYTTDTSQLTRDHMAKLHAVAQQNKAAKDPTGEEAAYQQTQELAAKSGKPAPTRLQFHQQWEAASAKPKSGSDEVSDYRLLSAQDREQKAIQPIIDKDATKIGDLNEADKMLDSKDSMGDAFAPVKALVGIAGGQGTGVRITTPELNRILEARGWGESAEVFLQHAWRGSSLSDQQRVKLHGILDDVRAVVREKTQIYKQYSADVNSAGSPGDIRAARSSFLKRLDDYESKGGKGQAQGRAVKVNGKIVGYTTDGKTMTPTP